MAPSTSCVCAWCVVQLFNSILLTLPRLATSSGGKSPADAVLDLAADIMGKLPVNYNMEAVCKEIHLCQCVCDFGRAVLYTDSRNRCICIQV